jgi:hypothetical protein
VKNSNSLLLAATLTLMACGSSLAATRQTPKTDLEECVAAVNAWDITLKHEMTSFMGVSKERMPGLFCQRLAEGIRSGRISYADVNSIQYDLPTEIWLVIKGKSKAAAAAQVPAPRPSKYRYCTGIDGRFQIPASQNCPLSGYAHY